MDKRRHRFRIRVISATLLAGVVGSCDLLGGTGFDTQVAWQGSGVNLVFDPHTHTKFSDGAMTVDALVGAARDSGCDAVAITDHSDVGDKVASDAYFAAIDTARITHPGLIVMAGMELNIPPYGGREHLGILVPQNMERQLLRPLMVFVEGENGEEPGAGETDADEKPLVYRDLAALKMLALPDADNAASPVVIYNHPSRRDTVATENVRDVKLWSRAEGVVVGFEGGPGHQKSEERGSYGPTFKTRDGWDPVIAEIGGTWDQLLAEGRNFWGALASSDYHNASMDYEPCAFSRTHVSAPERSIDGVLQALRAGTFWADQGRILDRLDVTLTSEKLQGVARPGDTIFAPRGTRLGIKVAFTRGPGAPGQSVTGEVTGEIIGNCSTGIPELIHRSDVGTRGSSFGTTEILSASDPQQTSCYIRVRITTKSAEYGTLHAYSNSIRIRIS